MIDSKYLDTMGKEMVEYQKNMAPGIIEGTCGLIGDMGGNLWECKAALGLCPECKEVLKEDLENLPLLIGEYKNWHPSSWMLEWRIRNRV